MPKGYFYFPVASGGLELWNVMLEVLASAKDNKPFKGGEDDDDDASDEGAEDWELSDDYLIDSDDWPEDMTAEEAFAKKIDNDKKAYRALKRFGITTRTRGDLEAGKPKSNELMSFEEFTSLRESLLQGTLRRDACRPSAYSDGVGADCVGCH